MILRQFFARVSGARQYDDQCRSVLKELWLLVQDDGCVMANPYTGQLEPDGWHVYVQYGTWSHEFDGNTLLRAAQAALAATKKKVADQ